jgi:hypothetical protein
LVELIVANETFSIAVLFDNQTNNLLKAQAMISAAWSKSKARQLKLALGFKLATI